MSGGLVDPVEIIPGLFLGSANASRKKDVLLQSNVSLIVNCAIEMENHFRDTFEYIHLQLEDEAEESVLHWYRQNVREILANHIQNGKSALIHCQAGISRSVSVVICFLMEHRKMRLKDAFLHVKQLRAVACPNSGFFRQLQQFEKEIFGSISFDWVEYLTLILTEYGFENQLVKKAVAASGAQMDLALSMLLTGNVRSSSGAPTSALTSARTSDRSHHNTLM